MLLLTPLYIKRETVIKTLGTLVEEFNTEELIEKLLFIGKVERGLRDVEEGKMHSFEEVKEQFQSKWSIRFWIGRGAT